MLLNRYRLYYRREDLSPVLVQDVFGSRFGNQGQQSAIIDRSPCSPDITIQTEPLMVTLPLLSLVLSSRLRGFQSRHHTLPGIRRPARIS